MYKGVDIRMLDVIGNILLLLCLLAFNSGNKLG